MGLFFDVLCAINDPNQQASVAQLETVINTMQELGASRGIEASKMQMVLSALSSCIRPALREQRNALGDTQLKMLMSDVVGSSKAAAVIHSLFSSELQEQMATGISQKTGYAVEIIQAMLPMLILAVLMMLNLGASTSDDEAANPLLNNFLESDRDSEVDLGEVFKFANRFLNPPQSLRVS